MVNLLITSCGRRTELIKYFKKEFENQGNIIVTDCDNLAPALYSADKYYITSTIYSECYIDELIKICKRESISGIFSLIDPEIELLGKNKEKFEKLGVMLIASEYKQSSTFFDKYKSYLFFENYGFNCAKTYVNINEFKKDLANKKIDFPVFVKPRKGSASIGINKINNLKHLEILFEMQKDLVIQEFIKGIEYGVDVYVDLISKEVVSIFIKEKIKMRAGETDKARSVKDEKLFEIIENLMKKSKLVGPIDIDVFKENDEWIISEINPRFGGGYPVAHKCNVNFPKSILNNLKELPSKRSIGNYEKDVYLIKSDGIIRV